MNLKELLTGLTYNLIKGDIEQEISEIAYDSRKVKKNSLFVCIEGYATDGHKYIPQAIENGAKAVIVQKDVDIKDDVTLVNCNNTRLALASVSSNYYKNPSKNFNLVGITGTKGKTTTTYMIKSILENDNRFTGLIGTISNKIGDEDIPTDRTTPESYDLQELFYNMKEKNVDSVVMEVSSHALDLHRVGYCDFDIGVFTNLSRDHLDFHNTFENYLNAKMKLLDMSKMRFINVDNEFSSQVLKKFDNNVYTYGINNKADIMAKNIKLEQEGVKFEVMSPWGEDIFEIKIPGEFNVYNSLVAISVCLYMKIDIENIKKGLLSVKIPGRAQIVETGKDFTVMIDYAHSPDSLENILNMIKGYAKGRIVCLVGCGGDRDRTKRPIMGKIAGDLADYVIVTSDNPRTEDPEFIISEIVDGIKETNVEYVKITDRREAIEYSLKNARKNDIILLAGKGHETYQMFKDKTINFDETAIVKDILTKL